MKALMIGMVIMAGMTVLPRAKSGDKQATVVLLHGIGHTALYMTLVEVSLRRHGYATLNITYPSRRENIDALAAFVHERLKHSGVWNKPGKVHFVTHSMGGLVAGRYLEKYRSEIPQEKMGRVVMTAPPSGGSEVADFLKDFPPYRWAFGPAGQELTTAIQTENKIKPWYDLGIIAGTKGWPYVVGDFVIPDDHDGLVAVARTKVPGMKDFKTVNATHTFISWRPDVQDEIAEFLENGEFDHGK